MNKYRLYLLPSVVVGLLAGCGGGSSSPTPEPPPPPPPNTAPVVTVSNGEAQEKAAVSVSATVEDDGEISSYQWEQISGPTVEIQGGDTPNIAFTAPSVLSNSAVQFRFTATDSEGLSTSTIIDYDIYSIFLPLELVGLATDGPIPNANVSLEVAGQTFQAKADENGAYSVTVQVDDDLLDSLVTATATGEEQDSVVKLTSLIGSMNELLDAAGEDGVLSVDESFNVNVTNVSTAIQVVLELANNGKIETIQQLAEAQAASDTNLILPLATAIKLVIDYAQSNPALALPEGVTDTLALISDTTVASDYIENALEVAPEVYEQAQQEIVDDPNLVDTNISESEVVGTYHFIALEGARNGGVILELNADGSGTEYDAPDIDGLNGAKALSWMLTSRGIEIYYDTPVVSSSFIVDEFNNQIQQDFAYISKILKVVAETGSNVQFAVTPTYQYTFPNEERDSYIEDGSTMIMTAVRSEGLKDSAEFLQMNVEYVVSIPTQTESEPYPFDLQDSFQNGTYIQYWYVLAEFSGSVDVGGTVALKIPFYLSDGTTVLEPVSANWTIDETGSIAIEVDGDQVIISTLAINNGITPMTSVRVVPTPEFAEEAQAGSGRMLFPQDQWTTENIPGIYVLDWYDLDDGADRFWLEIDADGTGRQISTFDNNGDGILTSDEISINPALWQLNTDGSVSFRRYIDYYQEGGIFCTPEEFDPVPSATCTLYNDRVLELYSFIDKNDEVRAHVVNTHKYYLNPELNVTGQARDQRILSTIYAGERYWIKQSERPINIDAALSRVANVTRTSGSVGKANVDIKALIESEISREANAQQP